VEFVEAVLNGDFLKGQCPPIESWLASMREELQQRNRPPAVIRRIEEIVSFRIVLLGLVAATALVSWWFIWDRRPILEPFRSDPIPIQNLAVLGDLEKTRSTKVLRDLLGKIQDASDHLEYGLYFLSIPLEEDIENPTVEVSAFAADDSPMEDGEAFIEIHWLPPNREHEKSGKSGEPKRLTDGIVTDGYAGRVPAGTIIAMFYHRREDKYGKPSFHIHVK
jgi:hypothetical protein